MRYKGIHLGVVKEYDPRKKTGIISTPEGEEYSFHRRRLRRIVPGDYPFPEPIFIGAHKSRGLHRPHLGDRVAFEVSRSPYESTKRVSSWGYLWDLQAAVGIALLFSNTNLESLEELAEKIAQAGA